VRTLGGITFGRKRMGTISDIIRFLFDRFMHVKEIKENGVFSKFSLSLSGNSDPENMVSCFFEVLLV
jgi:hypothetical protein